MEYGIHHNRRRGHKSFKQAVALLTSAAFILQAFPTEGIAQAAASPTSQNSLSTSWYELHPPTSLARIVDYSFNSSTGAPEHSSTPLVILIQDLHANAQVQKTIADLLEFYDQEKVLPKRVFIEGTEGLVDSSLLAAIPDEQTKETVCQELIHDGDLTGMEYFAAKKNQGYMLYGVENDPYYLVHRELFRKSYDQRQDFVRELKSFQNALEPVQEGNTRRAVRSLIHSQEAYYKGSASLPEYFSSLDKRSKSLNISLDQDYPALSQLRRLLDMEESIKGLSSRKIKSATAVVVAALNAKLSEEERKLLSKLAQRDSSLYYAYLDELVQNHGMAAQLPESLVSFLDYQRVLRQTDMARADHDLQALFQRIALASAETPLEKSILAVRKDIPQLVKLLENQLTQEELLDLTPRLKSLPQTLEQLFASTDIPFDRQPFEQSLQASLEFYAMAVLRDKPMAEHSLAQMEKQSLQTAVLVTGGFHTQGIAQLLKERGVSYIVLSPTVQEHTVQDAELYIRKLLAKDTLAAFQRTPQAFETQLRKFVAVLDRSGKSSDDVVQAVDTLNQSHTRILTQQPVGEPSVSARGLIGTISEDSSAQEITIQRGSGSEPLRIPVNLSTHDETAKGEDDEPGLEASARFPVISAALGAVFVLVSVAFGFDLISAPENIIDSVQAMGWPVLMSAKLMGLSRAELAMKVVTSSNSRVRDLREEQLFGGLNTKEMLEVAKSLQGLCQQEGGNLYHKVRACLLLHDLYRFYLFAKKDVTAAGALPLDGAVALEKREYGEAIKCFSREIERNGSTKALFTALGESYHKLAFMYLLDQVKNSIEAHPDNRWLFQTKSLTEYKKHVGVPTNYASRAGQKPLLYYHSPVRVELTSNVASDIFLLAMDRPEKARSINTSVELGRWDPSKSATDQNAPKPPIEVFIRVIDEPVIRLRSADLAEKKDVDTLEELFNFRNDYLSLLKAAVVASGVVPPSFEKLNIKLEDVLKALLGRRGGIEIVTKVTISSLDPGAEEIIARGSGNAVSTMLQSTMIMALMDFSGQSKASGRAWKDEEEKDRDRYLAVARTVLGEHLGGSGGGWQDAGGLWPGVKNIEGQPAKRGNPEHGISRGRLLPKYQVLRGKKFPKSSLKKMEDSMVLVFGGAASNVGPVLQMVAEQYLTRRQNEFEARLRSERVSDKQLRNLRKGDMRALGRVEDEDWEYRLAIAPLADNAYIDEVNRRLRAEFGKDLWGFDSTGCRGGAGGVYWVNPKRKQDFMRRFLEISNELKEEMGGSFPIVVAPVVYTVKISETGVVKMVLRGDGAVMPDNVVQPSKAAGPAMSLPARVKAFKTENGFDENGFLQLQKSYRQGAIGLEKNRTRHGTIAPAEPEDVIKGPESASAKNKARAQGAARIKAGKVGVVSLVGGAGTRFSGGQVAKPVYPVVKMGGRFRSFLEYKLSGTRRTETRFSVGIPHAWATSYATDKAVQDELRKLGVQKGREERHAYTSNQRFAAARVVPTERDLHYQRNLEETGTDREEHLRDLALNAEIAWAKGQGQGNMYQPASGKTSNLFHPMGHFTWFTEFLMNGTLARMLNDNKNLQYLFVSNADNLLADVDAELLDRHVQSGSDISFEVTAKTIHDAGGGLVREDDRPVLMEGLALPDPRDTYYIPYYSTLNCWISIDKLLERFGTNRKELIKSLKDKETEQSLQHKVDGVLKQIPTYVTMKTVVEDMGRGVRDSYHVAQFEQLWGDVTRLPFVNAKFLLVDRMERSGDMKELDDREPLIRQGLLERLKNKVALPKASVSPAVSIKKLGRSLRRIAPLLMVALTIGLLVYSLGAAQDAQNIPLANAFSAIPLAVAAGQPGGPTPVAPLTRATDDAIEQLMPSAESARGLRSQVGQITNGWMQGDRSMRGGA